MEVLPMTVQLSPQTEALLKEKVATGRYDNADALIKEALLVLDEYEQEEHERLVALRAALAAGEEEGGDVLFTPELAEQLRHEALQMAREGRTPHSDVCP
jgi:antitoxin ParD1/3/4